MTKFGIDLGTTYSCVAYVDDTGRAVIAKNSLGEETTPSVVQFEEGGNVVVGNAAKEFARFEPDSVASLVKRSMGEDVEYEFGGQIYTPEMISALILKELAESAASTTGLPVDEVVITVPAYFGVLEKEATRKAGEIAGLKVLDLIPEPVAAALHYDAMSSGSQKTILVYDLGGGTFDTTVIKIADDQIRVVCTDGNHKLGGADWDERLADYLIEQFENENPDAGAGSDDGFLQENTLAAENIKKQLSQAESRPHNMFYEGQSARTQIERAKFEELTDDLLSETIEITRRTIDKARELESIESFDEVLLVGGSTAMPLVATRLNNEFGFDAKLHDPHLAVAKGAALYATIASLRIELGNNDGASEVSEAEVQRVAMETGISAEVVKELSQKEITTVAPRAFGVKLLDSDDPSLAKFYVEHLIKANDALPAKPEALPAATVAENQTEIMVEVWEQLGAQSSPQMEYNAHIGEGIISGIPPLPAGSPLEISFAMDAMGKLAVDAMETTHNRSVQFEIQIGGMTDDQVEQARSTVAGIRVTS